MMFRLRGGRKMVSMSTRLPRSLSFGADVKWHQFICDRRRHEAYICGKSNGDVSAAWWGMQNGQYVNKTATVASFEPT